jgi:hypothetical protein
LSGNPARLLSSYRACLLEFTLDTGTRMIGMHTILLYNAEKSLSSQSYVEAGPAALQEGSGPWHLVPHIARRNATVLSKRDNLQFGPAAGAFGHVWLPGADRKGGKRYCISATSKGLVAMETETSHDARASCHSSCSCSGCSARFQGCPPHLAGVHQNMLSVTSWGSTQRLPSTLLAL